MPYQNFLTLLLLPCNLPNRKKLGLYGSKERRDGFTKIAQRPAEVHGKANARPENYVYSFPVVIPMKFREGSVADFIDFCTGKISSRSW